MPKVERAIIMAAGLGKRMHADTTEAAGQSKWQADDRYGN